MDNQGRWMRVLTGKWSEGVRGMTVVIPISEGALGASCVSAVEAGVRYVSVRIPYFSTLIFGLTKMWSMREVV